MNWEWRELRYSLSTFMLILLLFSPSITNGEGIIKLGWINPLTGPAAPWGLSNQCMTEATKTFINERGGITVKGEKYKVDVIYADDKYTVAGGRAAAEKLFYKDKVDFLISSFGAEPIAAWAPLAVKEKKLAVIGGPTWNPRPEWPYLFRVVASTDERSDGLCSVMKSHFGYKSVTYILTDDLDGKVVREGAERNQQKRGLEVKDYIMVPPNTTDFYPFLSGALKRNPDYLHCVIPPGSVALVVKQSRELGFKGGIGSPNSMPGDMVKWQGIAGLEASKGYIGIMFAPEEYSPLGKEYQSLFDKMCPKYKVTDVAYAMEPHILALAIEKAQSFNSDEILKILQNAEFKSFHKLALKAGGEKTFGIRNHMSVPVPYSAITGKDKIQYLGSVPAFTP